jgi:ABC-2 type transport system permease protein
VVNEALVRKMHFPRLVIPLSVVMTGVLNLLLNLVAVAIFFFAYGLEPQWTWLLLPVILIPLIIFAAAVAMLLSALYVRFRDVAPIWSVATTALFYGTPVLYAIDVVPKSAQRYLLFNPIADLLELGRLWIVDPTAPGPASAIGGTVWLLVPIGIFVAVCVAAWFVFEHEAPIVAERL